MTQTIADTMALPALINGTVIDHIRAGAGLTLIRVLELEHEEVSLALNLPSSLFGTKDLIKVRDRELSPDETDHVALLAPQATIIIVRKGEIVSKRHVQMPTHVRGIIECPNPRCITRTESLKARFAVLHNRDVVTLHCQYCEVRHDHH